MGEGGFDLEVLNEVYFHTLAGEVGEGKGEGPVPVRHLIVEYFFMSLRRLLPMKSALQE
jgi:hypothetical protein